MKPIFKQIAGAAEAEGPLFLAVGEAPARRLAYRQRQATGATGRPGLVWLGGFRSDMGSTKAAALDRWAGETGRACLRFDYSGHGLSDGRFEDGTIGDWLDDSLAVIRHLTKGPQILVGSSMGGWLALLCARALAQAGETQRLSGLVLIAPAVDFTEALIFARLPEEARRQLETQGLWLRPSAYAPEPYPITRRLIEEGRNHLLFDAPIRTNCPVHILQGLRDEDVPPQHAQMLVEHLAGDPTVLTLIKDGDHRLSRPEDLACLTTAIAALG